MGRHTENMLNDMRKRGEWWCPDHGKVLYTDGICPICESKKEEFIKRKEPQTNDFFKNREVLISYLKMKTNECDWHAVSDAANDLRVLEAENK